ncbi:hypothetical protein K439DRAFT_553540 [Ramaria rubella]|nr:hypothetical protein K439DRAFT_553540 [Ramaria rubella]
MSFYKQSTFRSCIYRFVISLASWMRWMFLLTANISYAITPNVTTGSPNLDKIGISISTQPTMHTFTPTDDIDTTPTTSTSTISGPLTSTPSYSKITASPSTSKKRPANNMEKTGNVPKNPRIGKDKNA